MWIIYSLLAAIIWALVNHIDKYLLEKYCKDSSAGALVVFSSLIGIPVVFIISLVHPDLYSVNLMDICILIVTGMTYLVAIIFYLKALEQDETSSVAPQMIIVPLLSGLLSAIILKENLSIVQIISIFFILLCSVGLSFNVSKSKINLATFKLMLMYSGMAALNTVLFKFMSVETSFWTTALWTHVGFIIFGVVVLIFYKPYRDDFVKMITENGSGILTVNVASEAITIGGNLIFNYATLLAPVALVQAFTEGIQPVFVFVLGIIFTLLFPKFAEEDISLPNILKKTVFITGMLITIIYQNISI